MNAPFYREPALERIARDVITAYDPNLYYGAPTMIPIEDIIEAQGITLEYQCLRKTGCILGETISDDGLAAVYDLEKSGQIPSADKLERIADYLDCSVDYLLGRTDNPAVNR